MFQAHNAWNQITPGWVLGKPFSANVFTVSVGRMSLPLSGHYEAILICKLFVNIGRFPCVVVITLKKPSFWTIKPSTVFHIFNYKWSCCLICWIVFWKTITVAMILCESAALCCWHKYRNFSSVVGQGQHYCRYYLWGQYPTELEWIERP